MSHESLDRLVMMANQISRFFAHRPEERAAADTAAHIRKFWDPRMRSRILAHLEQAEGKGLDPLALQAVRKLASDRRTP